MGGINVADAVLTAFHLQHHTALRTAAHCVSVVLAALAAWWVGRIVQGERLARAVTVVSALPALYLPATDTPLLYIGAAAVLTAVGEIGFRLRPRCRCGEERP
ncbi:hypothetical protein [Asanoa sp. NPDC050611]|uniref:hypothetical protein n=1 Tax=Asanoa sp. NPDC050611 TaxID=3157098 RepID=UPI0033EC183C